jgi:hypothetical protein
MFLSSPVSGQETISTTEKDGARQGTPAHAWECRLKLNQLSFFIPPYLSSLEGGN